MRASCCLSAYHLLAPQLVNERRIREIALRTFGQGVPTGGRIGEGSLSNTVSGRDVRVLLASSPDASHTTHDSATERQRMSPPAVSEPSSPAKTLQGWWFLAQPEKRQDSDNDNDGARRYRRCCS